MSLPSKQVVPTGGGIECPEYVHERRFARAGGAHDRDVFAFVDP